MKENGHETFCIDNDKQHNNDLTIDILNFHFPLDKIGKYDNGNGTHDLILICPDRKIIGDHIGISPALVYKYLNAASKAKILEKKRRSSENKMIYAMGYYRSPHSHPTPFLSKKRHENKLKNFSPY